MKENCSLTSEKTFFSSLGVGLAVIGLVLCGNIAQGQPAISGIAIPNSPNTQDGFAVGSVLLQGVLPPSANQLTFQVSSSTGVTALAVQLTATTLPGGVSVNMLTPSFGLITSGSSTSETVTLNLAPDTVYTALITASDAGGPSSSSITFDTINPNYFTFEAEDFDYNGGQFFDSLPPGTFNSIDAYLNLAATIGVDCNNHSGGGDSYRPNPLETEPAGDTPRIQYASSGYPDFDVGFNGGGDWGNYTRNYPAGVYNVYLRGSGGNGAQANACAIGVLNSGYGTTNQITSPIGQFSIAGLGWQTYSWCPAMDASGHLAAWVAGGDQETLQFKVDNGNCNENFYLLVPAVPIISPNTTNIYQGNPSTLSIFPYSLSAPTIQWQTDNGSGGATWANISGATSTNYNVPNGSLSLKPYEYQVLLTITSNSIPVTVTSAPVTLNILAASKPVIAQNTAPGSDTEVVGSVSSFTASFTGNAPITYQWAESVNGGANFQQIAGQTGTTLLVTNSVTETNYLFELVASNSFGSTASTPASLTVNPAPPRPPLQLAGDLIVNLQETDLIAGTTVWTNRTESSASVGNFQTQGKGALNIATNAPPWDAVPVSALNINDNGSLCVESALTVPAEVIGSKPCSVEAWAYASSVSVGGNNTVFGYGNQGGSGGQYEDREFDYNANNSGNEAFSGNFGGDFNWNTTPSAGVWHFLACAFDGTNVIAYVDGHADKTNSSQTMHTVASVAVVGGGLANAGPGISDQFTGYIASARLSSGVLTAGQVANNFAAGLMATTPVEVAIPSASPTNTTLTPGGTTTLSVADSGAAFPFTYQWFTDSGSGGQTWTAISGAMSATYLVDTTGLAYGTYEYEVELTNSTYSVGTISSPITIEVVAATGPEVVRDTTPASATMYVTQSATLSAAFSGEAPLDLQWQASADGTNFTDLSGETSSSLFISSDTPSTNYYRLYVINPLGTNASTPARVAIQTAPPLPIPGVLQTAGDVIVNLQPTDLAPGVTLWNNATVNTNSVGMFAPQGGGALNVSSNAPYLFHRVNALFVDQNISKAVQSALTAPAEITQNGAVSVEAWVFATAVNAQNSCAVGYGLQGASAAPQEDREFNYEAGFGGGSTSGDFGNYDSSWSTPPETNSWHYLAWAWDGGTVTCYVDGNYDHAQTPGSPLITAATVIGVGGGLGGFGSTNITVDAFQGYIGAARVESGVLNSDQVLSNYTAGLFGTVPVSIYPPPIQFSVNNGLLTLNYSTNATLLQSTKVSGPWKTNAAPAPYTLNPSLSGTNTLFYKLQYNE